MQPVHALHQLAYGVDDRAELDANRSVLARRLDDDGELKVVGKIEAASVALRKGRRVDAVEREDLLRNRLVLREHQAVRARACVLLANELEIAGDFEVGGVVPVE